jgi:pimeloyl-ACP methyl ester carboxylesterase
MTVPRDESRVTREAGAGEEAALPVDGGRIYLCQAGPRGAPAFVFIHGSGSSSRTWDPMVALLSESHRVIRIDLIGHGRSDKPAGGDYDIPAQARRVARALDLIGVERAVAVGHSSGGNTVTALTEQRPDLVTGLVLVNTGAHPQARIAASDGVIEASQWPRLTDEQLRQIASSGFSRPGYQPPHQVLDDVRRMTHHTFTATMRASRAYIQCQPLADRLAPLGKPLLVIFGEDDRRWRSSSAADYHTIAGAWVEMLPGLGHSPHLEDPSRTATLLRAFATALATRTDGRPIS